MKRTMAGIALVCGLAFGLTACGGDDTGGSDADALIDQLVELGAPRDEAECVVGELGADAAAFLLEVADEDSDFVPSDEQTALLAEAGEACDLG